MLFHSQWFKVFMFIISILSHHLSPPGPQERSGRVGKEKKNFLPLL